MLDIHKLMAALARHRLIFHSEADFQHALAWQIHKAIPNCEIRLEMPYRISQKNWYLDIWLQTMEIAIELKYRTKRIETKIDGEYFLLKNHSGYSQGWSSFHKDIQRLERVVADRRAKSGFAVLLTNDPNFWKPPNNGTEGSYPSKWQDYSHWTKKEGLFSVQVPPFRYLAVSVK